MQSFDRKLVVGVETELGLVTADTFDYFSASQVQLPPVQFLDNGMRLYRDGTAECRDRLEAATAEAPDPLAAVRCLRGALLRTRSYLPDNVLIITNNVDSVGNSWGTHENYLCKQNAFQKMELLAPHLASRIIYTGAGFLDDRKKFLFSSRIEHIDELSSYSTLAGECSRGLLNTRREAHVGEAVSMDRLHIISGESNIFDQANFLKLGCTAIVLKLLEDGCLPDVKQQPQSCVYFAHELNECAHELLRSPKNAPHSVKRAISIQRAYLDAAVTRYGDGAPPWLSLLFSLWADTLNRLETNPSSLVGTIDWVTKNWVAKQLRQSGFTPSQAFWNAELEFCDANSGLHAWLIEENITKPLFDQAAVERAANMPPRNTRAWGRGGCIRELQDPKNGFSISAADWESLEICFSTLSSTLRFDDPQDPGESQLRTVRAIKLSSPRSRWR